VLVVGIGYGFQGQEKDDEIKGEGNSYDFGARMYDSRIGRMRSLDAYASKYPSVSPFAFVANNPISNIEMGGDSVLFYSSSGVYLGYSNDNWRYEGKNLLVIIDVNSVEAFRKQYNTKRNMSLPEGKTELWREAVIAGLEGMGTTYDMTQISGFIRKYTELLGPASDKTIESPVTFSEDFGRTQIQQEWGVWLITSENPKVKGKMNWVTIDESTITTDEDAGYVAIPTIPDNGKSWLHLHTSSSKKSEFSGGDLSTMRTKGSNPYYKNVTYWVGQVQFEQESPGKESGIKFFYHDENNGNTIFFNEKSFKNAN
jgi:RHS repeat-associated protein